MTLGPEAYRIAAYIIDSHYSLHDLYATLTKVDRIDAANVEQYMKRGLSELARLSLIEWTYEPAYGDRPGEHPLRVDEAFLARDFDRCVSRNRLHCGVPDTNSPTLLIMASANLHADDEALEPRDA